MWILPETQSRSDITINDVRRQWALNCFVETQNPVYEQVLEMDASGAAAFEKAFSTSA
jgi:hypothetical protein